MSSIIKIKRSGTAGAPPSLQLGELAVSYLGGTESNNGDRLFVGVSRNGNAEIDVIGGKYFTDMMDHSKGTLTASSAIITDASNKIDVLNVDNVTIDGNTISTTDTNGNLVLAPNGTGNVDVNAARVTNMGAPTVDADAATKKYVDDEIATVQAAVSGSTLTINDGTTTDTVNLTTENVTFTGGTGLTTAVTDNEITVTLDDTAVTAASYGSGTKIPTFTVDQQGRLTAAGEADVATQLGLEGSTISDTGSVDILTDTLSFAGATTPVTVAVSGSNVSIAVADATTTTKGLASFDANHFDVTAGAVTVKAASIENGDLAGSIANEKLVNSEVTVNGQAIALGGSHTFTTTDIAEGDNLYYTPERADSDAKNAIVAGAGVVYDPVTGEISTSQGGSFTDLTVSGNLTVNGTQTILNTEVVSVEDPMIQLGNNNPADTLDMGFVSKHSGGTYTGIFRDATDGAYKVFDGLTDHNDSDNDVDVTGTGFALADLHVNDLYGNYVNFNSDLVAAIVTGQDAEGIDVTDNGDGTITIAAELASDTNKGVASFDATNFTVTEGAVASNDITLTALQDGTANGTAAATLGEGLSLSGDVTSGAIVTGDDATTMTFSVAAATKDQRGTASFDSAQFTVTAGAVQLVQLDGGSF